MPRASRLPDTAVRYLAWLCLFLMLWPGFVVAASAPPPGAVPVVTKISGAVSIRGSNGVSNEVISTRIVHSGDVLMTGVDSLALVNLADVGGVRIGPTSTITASATSDTLAVKISSGSACAQALSRGVSITAGPLVIAAGDETAIFSLLRTTNATTLAVYQGSVLAHISGSSAKPLTFKAGDAATSTGGAPQPVPLESVQPSFSALQCPDPDIVQSVLPSPPPNPSAGGSHGGGAGTIIGVLLGLGAIAAAAGHGGGGGGGSPPTAPPTVPPGSLQVSTNTLTFDPAGAPQQFTASEANYHGSINAASNDTTVATVSPASGSGPSASFTVTPVGAPGTSTTIVVTDNHGGSQVVNVIIIGALQVSTNSLTFAVQGPPQQFTASETNYQGPINAVSADTTVATVSPASGNGPGPVTFTVTAVGGTGSGGNSTTITVTDNHGGQQIITVTIGKAGTIVVNPGSLTFLLGGASQTFKASEANYAGPLTAVSNDTNVATVSGSGNGPGPVTFTVTPVNAGTTTLTVNGTGTPASVSITVIGPLQANPNSLTFAGTQQSMSFLATDPFYMGTLTAVSSDVTVATVSPATASGPSATFSVTPVNASANPITVTVSDSFGGSTQVSVVVSAGGLIVNPGSLTLALGGATKTFTASEADYTGPLRAKSSNKSQATVSPATQSGPGPDTFTVTAVAAGNPSVAITDNNSNIEFVNLAITGPLTVGPPSSLTFNGTTAPQNLNVSDPNYFGAIGASSSNQNVATVNSPVAGPNATFSITPISSGTATVTFTDANLASAIANITVNPGPLQTSTNSVTLNGAGSSTQFTASEVLYTGAITATSNDKTVVTVSPASGGGPGPVTYTLDAVGPGSTTVDVKDDHGGDQPITVMVSATPVLVPTSVALTDVGPSNGTNVSISEPGYNGAFAIVSNSCASGIATIGNPGSGPSSSVSVSGNATASGGSCTFAIKDTFGNTSLPEDVTVGPFGLVAPSPTSLTFSDITNTQSFTVSENNYTGPFTIDQSACNGIASVSPASGTSATQFVVTPKAGGGPCNLVVSDDHTQSSNVGVTVGPFGAITPNPTSFTFTDVGAGAAQPLTVSESGYTGSFTIDATACSGIATVNPSSSTGSFTVTPIGQGGPCDLNVTDDHGSTAVQVAVTVGPFGPVTPSTGALNLVTGGSNGTFTVSETSYTGNFTITQASCISTGAASVSPSSGNAATTFTVTPLAAGNCKAVVTDDAGDNANVDIFVTSGSIVVTPDELQFASGSAGAMQTFTVSDPACGPTDTVTAIADGTVAASVSPTGPQPCGTGGGSVTYTVTAGSDGQGSVTVQDTAGGKATVSVGVGQSPLKKKHKGLGSHKPVPKPSGTPRPGGGHNPALTPSSPRATPSPQPIVSPAPKPLPQPIGALRVSTTNVVLVLNGMSQSVSVSEPGYQRALRISSANESIASANLQSALGPNVTLVIVPKGVGATTIQIADDHGGVQVISVTVHALSPKGGRPVN